MPIDHQGLLAAARMTFAQEIADVCIGAKHVVAAIHSKAQLMPREMAATTLGPFVIKKMEATPTTRLAFDELLALLPEDVQTHRPHAQGTAATPPVAAGAVIFVNFSGEISNFTTKRTAPS